MKLGFNPRRRDFLGLLGATALLPTLGRTAPGSATGSPLRKRIPSSGSMLPVIGLGTSRVFNVGPGEDADAAEVLQVLARAEGAMIDTSPMYGAAEAAVGRLARQTGTADAFFYATKVWIEGRGEGIGQMQTAFDLMNREVMDLMQVHNLLDWQTHLRTLRDWKEQGRIRHIGITHYHAGAHPALERVLRDAAGIDFLQVNYSLLEPESARSLLPLARERGVAVIANRPFARGRWFAMTRGKPLPPWAAELGIGSWAQFALKWIVSHPAVTVAIPGTGRAKHMRDNLGAALAPLPDARQREAMALHVAQF